MIPPAPKIILTKLIVPIPAKIAGQPLAWIEINNMVTHRANEVPMGKKQKGFEMIVEGMCEGDCKIQILHKQGRKVRFFNLKNSNHLVLLWWNSKKDYF